jgi:hypothetical protein
MKFDFEKFYQAVNAKRAPADFVFVEPPATAGLRLGTAGEDSPARTGLPPIS